MRQRRIFSVLVLAITSAAILWRCVCICGVTRVATVGPAEDAGVIPAEAPHVHIRTAGGDGAAFHFVGELRGVPRAPATWLCLAPVWSFGDGTPEEKPTRAQSCGDVIPRRTFEAKHDFLEDGLYTVRLRLFDARARAIVQGAVTVAVSNDH